MLKKNMRCDAVALLLISLMLASSLTLLSSSIVYAQEETMTFTSGETISFTSTEEMTFKDYKSMQFWSGETMKFGTGIRMRIVWFSGPDPSYLQPCTWVQVIWPEGYLPEPCSWWEAIDPNTGALLGEFHVDGQEPPDLFHIDEVFPQQPIPVPLGGVILAEKKIHTVAPCDYYVVHWPSDWWPQPCSWWEIIDPDSGELTGYEFHVDWTNESCEFHIDAVIPEPWGPWYYGAYEVEARRKIPSINPCDYFVVEEPPDWWPKPCTWWEIIDPYSLEPTGYNFHVDWTNESCEFHVDGMDPGPYVFEPPVPYVIAEQKIQNITACDWFIIVDPQGFLPESCSWWEILDAGGAPTGLEFHVDTNDGLTMFHVDETAPDTVITIPPSYTVTVVQKIDDIQQCNWFKVDDPLLTPEPCSWWEVLDPVTGEPTGWEFHADDSTPPYFHVDTVYPGPSGIPPTYELTAERKIDDISPCDWFKVIDPPTGWVPEACSWWEIISPAEWEGVIFHVDSNNGVDMFHIDIVDGGGPPPPPPKPPSWNVTARSYEPPPLQWYMKPPYPDYAPSGMPDFDQRQGGTYLWQDLGGRWSHCGPVAVGNSLWWLDSEFESNPIPPPAVIDNYPLVQAYGGPPWDDHDPQNVPPLVEHLAFLMDTDGLRTGIPKLGTDVFDMQAGITHYLSWSGVNPLGDVDGDGNVTALDEAIVTMAMGTAPGMLGWDLRADIYPVTLGYPPVADNVIDINDLNLVLTNLGATGQFYEHTVMAPMWDIIMEEVLRCQDVVLLIAPWIYDAPTWYRYDEGAHFVTVAGLNATAWEIVLSDPIRDNAEAGGAGDVPVPHVHLGPEPPYVTHNNATLVSHDMYPVTLDTPCPGGPLTIVGYPGSIASPLGALWQIEAAVITSPYAVSDVAVIDVTTSKTGCVPMPTVGQGLSTNVTVAVENQGDSSVTFNVTAFANSSAIGELQVTLNPGENKTLTFIWDTTSFSYGSYIMKAVADTVLGETDTADNTYTDGVVRVVIAGDINGDGIVDIFDALALSGAFGSEPGDLNWNPNSDLISDNIVDIFDALVLAGNFGEEEP